MAYSIEVKNEVQERLKEGKKAEEISEQKGISLSTIYKWKEEVETNQRIKQLIKLEQFDRVLELTEKYPDNFKIQSKRIKILTIQGKLEEGKRIGNREEFVNYEPIQSQMITIALREGNIEEAKRIGNREKFMNNGPIQSQMITIALREGNVEEAKRIENRKEFIDSGLIQSQMKLIEKKEIEKKLMTQLEEVYLKRDSEQKENTEKQFLNRIRTKIYYNRINEEDIEEIKTSSEISEYEKSCILLAIYEKQKNIQVARQIVKKYKKENPESKHNKIFNIIMQRVENKKSKIFDYLFYDDLLHWKTDEELKEEYEQECKKESERKLKKQNEIIINVQQKVKNNATNKTKKTNDNAKDQRNERSFRERIKVNQGNKANEVAIEKRIEDSSHFNEILEYLEEKRRFIYVKAQSRDYEVQRKGISQWDRMEVLLEKVKENRDNKEYLNPLYEKILRLKAKEKNVSREEI